MTTQSNLLLRTLLLFGILYLSFILMGGGDNRRVLLVVDVILDDRE